MLSSNKQMKGYPGMEGWLDSITLVVSCCSVMPEEVEGKGHRKVLVFRRKQQGDELGGSR